VGKADAAALGAFVRLGGFTEQLKKNGFTALLAKYNDLDDALRAKFISDFGSDANALAHFNLNSGELVNVWKLIENSPIRTSYYWLTRINGWNKARMGFTYASVGNVVKVFRSGTEVAEINQTFLKIIFRGFGGDIICPIDRTVTVIGLYQPNVPFMGTWYFTNDFKLYKTVWGNQRNHGGLNLLNLPDNQWTWDKNRDWLQDAVDRGDIIRIISDPSNPRTIWKNGISPGQEGYNGVKTNTGREIEHLQGQSVKYIYDANIPGYRSQ
jgi:hypothetical protein